MLVVIAPKSNQRLMQLLMVTFGSELAYHIHSMVGLFCFPLVAIYIKPEVEERTMRDASILSFLVVALGVAVAIPWIAHAVGILLKRGSDPWWKSGLGVATLLFLTIGGLLAIGYVRVEYLSDLNAAAEGGISSFGNSKLIGAAFIGLNLVILAAATLCSYFAHDKDPLLEHLHRRTNKLNQDMREIEAKHNKILTKQDQDIKRIHQQTQEIIYYYRKINQRERPDHQKPKSFERDHELVIDYEEDSESQKMLNATAQFNVHDTTQVLGSS